MDFSQSARCFYVRVSIAGQFEAGYDVGPFPTSNNYQVIPPSAIDWIYQQIGLIKLNFPQAELIKHG